MSDKEQHRNLKREVGRQAAEAIQKAEATTQQLAMQHRVLAAQMLDFEKTVATVRVGRAHDVNELRGLISAERTHRLELAEQQRSYVDSANKEIYRSMARRAQVAEDGFELVLAQLNRFERMTFWQRLRWNVTGKLPLAPATLGFSLDSGTHDANYAGIDRSPATAYPGDGL